MHFSCNIPSHFTCLAGSVSVSLTRQEHSDACPTDRFSGSSDSAPSKPHTKRIQVDQQAAVIVVEHNPQLQCSQFSTGVGRLTFTRTAGE
jgi:hypothetical protein